MERLKKASQRKAFASFCARVTEAVQRDPQETEPVEVSWEEWEAYAEALNDCTGG
jgi:hypothetical protein